MRIPIMPSRSLLSFIFLSVPTSIWAFDCKHIVKGDYRYSLAGLNGVHTIHNVESTDTTITNTTYVLNICAPLKEASSRDDLQCGTGKNSTLFGPCVCVCGCVCVYMLN